MAPHDRVSIVEVRCSPGATVEAGDVLLVIESMKMNNELKSPAAGIVEQVPVKPGERVNAGALLVAIHVHSPSQPRKSCRPALLTPGLRRRYVNRWPC